MCGRFTLRVNPATVQQAFNLDEAPRIEPRYNIAPSQQVLAVRYRQRRNEQAARSHRKRRPGLDALSNPALLCQVMEKLARALADV
jgi:putative SOS response-associated peptidase YedK